MAAIKALRRQNAEDLVATLVMQDLEDWSSTVGWVWVLRSPGSFRPLCYVFQPRDPYLGQQLGQQHLQR